MPSYDGREWKNARRMMRMRILPLEYLTVMFSSKMAMSEQRHGLSCQFRDVAHPISLKSLRGWKWARWLPCSSIKLCSHQVCEHQLGVCLWLLQVDSFIWQMTYLRPVGLDQQLEDGLELEGLVSVGVNLFYFCIIIYLYGDLAIYAAAVPVSLMQVTCSATGNHSCSVGDGTKYNDTDKCWGPIRRIDAYRLYLAAFTLLLGPFTFFNVQKTKYLQIMTSLMRWIAFILMIILALIRISRGQAEGHPSMAQLSGIRNLFGVCVYSFMCQHSLPSLITPISKKKHVNKLVLLDYILILAFYSLLSFTAIYCFRNDTLMDMYTLNFTNCEIINIAFIRYFLGLFPVFTISTNFPIIAVTLRNNWKTLFHREGGTYPWVVDRIVFPAITLIPPVLVAFCTHDLESLVGITGAYAGNGIQYLIPAFLAYCSRKDTQLVFGSGTVNKHLSPFRHTFWIVFVLIWGFSCFVFVTANIVLSESKL
ncbi:transmembrane protein 104 isoform X3 [Accipiter gentilis]|uniref:transmembrane protein 104 isoform X3 n=1 Tax=Astur gentilis TaxID=8957 RepID=UPI0021107436|nr:transmembrane protein 104 isoform X3 [Accipiter gentilis]